MSAGYSAHRRREREIIFRGLNSWIASSKGKMEQNAIGRATLCVFKKAVWKVYYWHSPPLNFTAIDFLQYAKTHTERVAKPSSELTPSSSTDLAIVGALSIQIVC